MGRAAYDASPRVRALFAAADEILGYPLSEICFSGPAERLNSTVCSQPALYVTSLAALETLRESRPELIDACSAAAGLSLGEYTAITFAGGLTFEDGLRLVQRRGEAMQQAADRSAGGMVSVLGLDREAVESVCRQARVDGEVLQVANLLGPGNIVVSGHRASCERVPALAEAAGAMRCVELTVAGAFHTELMGPAAEWLDEALAATTFADTRLPVVSNVDATPHHRGGEFPALLRTQLGAPVRWQESMERLLADGYDAFYEIGAGRVLKGLLKRIDRQASCENVMC